MIRGKLLLAHRHRPPLKYSGEKEANIEAHQSGVLEHVDEIGNPHCGQNGEGPDDQPEHQAEDQVELSVGGGDTCRCVASHDDDVEIIYHRMDHEGVRRDHVQGGEQQQVIGQEAESKGMIR